jgi:hypothetical protein
MGDINESGKIIEDFIKDTFNSLLGNRFRATSGYIVYAESINEPFKFSPHVDIIIVDTLVPNIIFPYKEFKGKTEFVPQQAVVGIFEVKKSLNCTTLKESLDHICKIKDAVQLIKNNNDCYVPGGAKLGRGLCSEIYSNPIFGIVGLENKEEKDTYYEKISSGLVDIIFTLDGFLQVCVKRGESSPYIGPINNPEEYTFQNNEKDISNLNLALGYIINYLQHTSGKSFNAFLYYGNKSSSRN